MIINWTDSFSVGDPVIDEDHKILIGHINEFKLAADGEADLKNIEHIFSDLKTYTVEHFQREESLMNFLGYPETEKHKKSHRNITAKLEKMQNDIYSANTRVDIDKAIKNMSAFLSDWLIRHIMEEDRLYKDYVEHRATILNGGQNGRASAAVPSPGDRRASAAVPSPGDRRASAAVPPPSDRRASAAVLSPSDRRASAAVPPPGDRRASAAVPPPGDRRASAAVPEPGNFPTGRVALIVVLVVIVIAVIAGGGYWLYGGVDSSSVAKNSPAKVKSNSVAKAPVLANASQIGLEWVANSKCDPIPKVAWWKNSNHLKIARYVVARHGGNWKPYIKKWLSQLKKLKGIRSRGAAALAPGGKRLEGKDLDSYISEVSKRVDIVNCLADEAAAYAAR